MAIEKLKFQGKFATATQRLYLTRGEDQELVEHGDLRAAFLFCAEGQLVDISEAKKFGLVATEEKESEIIETKEGEPEETKPIWPAETKRSGRRK